MIHKKEVTWATQSSSLIHSKYVSIQRVQFRKSLELRGHPCIGEAAKLMLRDASSMQRLNRIIHDLRRFLPNLGNVMEQMQKRIRKLYKCSRMKPWWKHLITWSIGYAEHYLKRY